jgi:hypothetical protein
MFYYSLFLSLFPQVPKSSSTITDTLYVWVCIWSCMVLCICLFLYLSSHMRGNVQLLCFWSWLTSVNMMSSNCIHLPSNYVSLFFRVEYYSTVYIYHIFLNDLSVVGHLGFFQSMAIVNSAVMNIDVRCLYCIISYIPLGWYPGMVSLHHMAVLFLAFCGIFTLHSGCSNFHSHQQCMRVLH